MSVSLPKESHPQSSSVTSESYSGKHQDVNCVPFTLSLSAISWSSWPEGPFPPWMVNGSQLEVRDPRECWWLRSTCV